MSIKALDRQTVYIIAGGPSVTLTDIRAIGRLRAADKCRVIAVNDAVYPCWFADGIHACDRRWWTENRGVPGFTGWKTSVESTPFSDVTAFEDSGLDGYDPRPQHIRTGGNSGYQAVHLAASLGAKTIIMLGVDYTNGGARDHWFGLHEPHMDRASEVDAWRLSMRGLVDDLAKRGVTVLNAGKFSTLTWLPKVNIGSLETS